jgi:hypothetical protein
MIRNLFIGICTSALLTGIASAAYQFLWVEYEDVTIDGESMYVMQLSAKFSNPGDRVIGVSASEFVSNKPFYQHIFGEATEPKGWTIPFTPELAYDTFVTVGLTSYLRPFSTPTALAPGAAFQADSFTGGWSATSDADYTMAGPDGKVLLGQFTLPIQGPTPKVSAAFIMEWVPAGGQAESIYVEYSCMGPLTPIFCPTLTTEIDVNDDCIVNGLDLADFLAHWGLPCPNPFDGQCIGDFNNDNFVNGLDLPILLSAWGAIPVCPPE